MAVRNPLVVQPGVAPDPYPQIYEMSTAGVNIIHQFAPWVLAQNPAVRIEVGTANGAQLGGQPFVDTFMRTNGFTTSQTSYPTDAPDIVQDSDNYSRLRLIQDSVSLPTSDVNNFEYPLYLYNTGTGLDIDTQFRAMTRADFIDTFVTPALTSHFTTSTYFSGNNNKEQAGTYYLSTNLNPSGGTAVSSTPVAVNKVADTATYAANIGGVNIYNTETNYYMIKVNPSSTEFALYDAPLGTYDLPLYFDAGTEELKTHTPTSWANLLGPFLRYYTGTAGTGYTVGYNLDGTGANDVQKGVTYADTRRTTAFTRANAFFGVDDYRTQEYPSGAIQTIAGNEKRFYIGGASTSQWSVSASSTSVYEGRDITFTMTSSTAVANGTTLNYTVTGIGSADLYPGDGSRPGLTGTIQTVSNAASVTFTIAADTFTDNESMTFTCNGLSSTVPITNTTYGLSVASNPQDEGVSNQFTFTNTALDTHNFWWRLSSVGAAGTMDASDFTGTAPQSDAAAINFTTTSGTYTFNVTTAADVSTEGSENYTAYVYAEDPDVETDAQLVASLNVTVTDTSVASSPNRERHQLEGTTSALETDATSSPPNTYGDITLSWEFTIGGAIVDAYVVGQTGVEGGSFVGHAPWCTSDVWVNNVTFGTTAKSPTRFDWYIWGEPYNNTGQNGVWQTGVSPASQTWTALDQTRVYTVRDTTTVSGPAYYQWHFKISANPSGGTWTSPSTYQTTAPITYWKEELYSVDEGGSTYEYSVVWNGFTVYGPVLRTGGFSSVTGTDGFTYNRGTFQTQSNNGILTFFGVVAVVPEKEGYYRWDYNGDFGGGG